MCKNYEGGGGGGVSSTSMMVCCSVFSNSTILLADDVNVNILFIHIYLQTLFVKTQTNENTFFCNLLFT